MDSDRSKVLGATVRHLDVIRGIILAHVEGDLKSCIASSGAVAAALQHFGIPALAMPVKMYVVSAGGLEALRREQAGEALRLQLPRAAFVGFGNNGETRGYDDNETMWRGHLITLVPGRREYLLIDPSADQVNRPGIDMEVKPFAATVPFDFVARGKAWRHEGGVIAYRPTPDDKYYRSGLDWELGAPIIGARIARFLLQVTNARPVAPAWQGQPQVDPVTYWAKPPNNEQERRVIDRRLELAMRGVYNGWQRPTHPEQVAVDNMDLVLDLGAGDYRRVVFGLVYAFSGQVLAATPDAITYKSGRTLVVDYRTLERIPAGGEAFAVVVGVARGDERPKILNVTKVTRITGRRA